MWTDRQVAGPSQYQVHHFVSMSGKIVSGTDGGGAVSAQLARRERRGRRGEGRTERAGRTAAIRGLAMSLFRWATSSSRTRTRTSVIETHMTQKPMLRVEVGACRFAQQTSTKNHKPSYSNHFTKAAIARGMTNKGMPSTGIIHSLLLFMAQETL